MRIHFALLAAVVSSTIGCGSEPGPAIPELPLPQNLQYEAVVEEFVERLRSDGFDETGVVVLISSDTASTVWNAVIVMQAMRDAPFTVATRAGGDLHSLAGWMLVAGSPGHRSMPAGSSLDLRVTVTTPPELSAGEEEKLNQALLAGIESAIDPGLEIPVARLLAGEFGILPAAQALDLGLIDSIEPR